jgi:hypothetical protein
MTVDFPLSSNLNTSGQSDSQAPQPMHKSLSTFGFILFLKSNYDFSTN